MWLSTSALGTACSEPQEKNPGDAYVSAAIADAITLNPILASDAVSHGVTAMMFNGLTKIDDRFDVIGDMASSWSIAEDGLSATFYLRRNIRWHDGEPFTALDVKFTFDRILDPTSGCPYISSYDHIQKIDILDDFTIKFYFSRPYAPFLSKMGMSILPKHLLSGVNLRTSEFGVSPVGTGPYRFGKWKRDQYIILEGNEDYFEHTPYIDKYVMRILPDPAIQFLELMAGTIDSMSLTPYQHTHRSGFPRFRERFKKYTHLARSYTYIGYNLKDPHLSDPLVRRALSYAIDKKDIINGALLGLGEICTGPFYKKSAYNNPQANAYAYDPGKARSLLAEAGWEDLDGDGFLEKDGTDLEVTILINQGNNQRQDAATIVERYWQAIGVRARVRVLAWPTLIENFIRAKKFQCILLGWTIPIDPDLYTVWHSRSAEGGGLNFISYDNPEVDKLIEQGRASFDTKRRVEIYKDIHRLIAEDAPYTFLYFPYASTALSKRFRGVKPGEAGIGYHFIDWYVDRADQKY